MSEDAISLPTREVGPSSARAIGWSLVIIGLLIAAGALGADLLLSHGPVSTGIVQTSAALVGVAMLFTGIAFASDAGQVELAAWTGAIAHASTTALLNWLSVVVPLVLIALAADRFQVENAALYTQVLRIVVVGFVLHHLVPQSQRLRFFVAVSLAGFLLVLGWVNALWVVAIVGSFVAIGHLPAPYRVRFGITVIWGLALTLLRANPTRAPWTSGLWPIVGSILMFRVIVYLYDLKHAKQMPKVSQSLGYFFQLPNVVFPLFPVVDFTAFTRGHYDQPQYSIYRRGVLWMSRGLVHLLLYRVVYQFMTIAPSEVSSTFDLLRYIIATFLLYLRVSGQFHLIVGMLYLFGFRLPETHHMYYLASSFTNFWRRINIYWKDFMMKVVFYPVYFPLRKKTGEKTALVLATLAVFFITWLTHGYQWFWILGSWLISWTDGLFWGILGALLIVNSLWELKHGRRRALPSSKLSAPAAVSLALRTVGTFAVISVLWTLWASPTLGDFTDLMTVRAPTLFELATILGLAVCMGAIAVWADWDARRQAAVGPKTKQDSPARDTFKILATLGALCLITLPSVSSRFSERWQVTLRQMRMPELNQRDAATLTRGYYENLTDVGTQNSQLWEIYARRPMTGADVWQSGVLHERPDFLARELVPNFGIVLNGVTFTTNRWGMRDRDYTLLPAANTYRIALMGQSYVAGDGVTDGKTFEQLTEDRLNEVPGAHPKVEILNFAVGSMSLLQQRLLFDRVVDFHPNAVYVVEGSGDPARAALHLVEQLKRHVALPDTVLAGIVRRAGVTADMRENEALSRLKPYRDSLVDWALRGIAQSAKARGILPVWIYLSVPEPKPGPSELQHYIDQARADGFVTVDWSDVYDGYEFGAVRVSPWDHHPNAMGHHLIAQRMFRDMTSDGALGVPVHPSQP
jgi:hypothetical protein